MNDTPTPPLKEALIMYGGVFLVVLALAIASQFNGLISSNLYLIVAAVFMGVPYLWMQRRGLDPEAFGMSTKRLLRQIGIGLIAGLLTFVPFAAGQYVWETQVQKRSFTFDVENWYQWPLSIQGAPPQGWGEDPGAWIWLDEDDALHVGIRSEEQLRGGVLLKSETPFVPHHRGAGVVWRAIDDKGSPRTSKTPQKFGS